MRASLPTRSDDSAAAQANHSRWAAVLARDWRADGRFVYAVTTTGVYCLPSCPSRRPRPRNVRFFDSTGEAESAGFRACRRCRPRQGASNSVAAIQRARAWLDAREGHRPTLAALARVAGLSPYHLQRTFKRLVGMTPREYSAAQRTLALKRSLQRRPTVTDAIYDAGFGSASRVYEQADARLGMTPDTYRRGAAGLIISFDIVGSPLGRMLLASTDRGLCKIAFGDSDAKLRGDLAREFAHATLVSSRATLRRWTAEVLRRLEGDPARLDIPLDLRGTAFQSQVWSALRRIPSGETRSYGTIANAIGLPRGARAVARACSVNPVAVLVPCHRVVAQGTNLGGYRWGVDRKRALLEIERAADTSKPAR